MSEWTVRINGVDRVNVKPGDCVEIGRKPLRPLADDGMQRLDVVDQTKSMSKRHAVFEVKQNGSAAVRDLGSTNGSYVVRDNGDLLRLPVDAEFMLPSSPMRMQFGDVPADFIRIDDVEHDQQLPVPDLFGYAVNEAPQEPDAADMSVDDILDLRAGEPTAAFSAASVRHKVDELDFSSLNIAQSVVKAEEPATPRDLFADAMAEQSEDTVPDGEAQQTQPAADFVPQTSPQAEPVEPAEPSALPWCRWMRSLILLPRCPRLYLGPHLKQQPRRNLRLHHPLRRYPSRTSSRMCRHSLSSRRYLSSPANSSNPISPISRTSPFK